MLLSVNFDTVIIFRLALKDCTLRMFYLWAPYTNETEYMLILVRTLLHETKQKAIYLVVNLAFQGKRRMLKQLIGIF